VGLTRINLPDKRGFIEPVTSADSSKDGAKSTFIVADETHLWILPRLKRLHGVMTRNLLKRKVASGWMLETSTMYGEGEESVAEGTHAYAVAVGGGRRHDRSLLFDHRQSSDSWDLSKRDERLAALREAYGPAAEWMPLEAIADSWDDPQVSEAEFRRYWLNQPVPMLPAPRSIFGSHWSACLTEDRHLDSTPILALACDFELSHSAIGAASVDADGMVWVKSLRHGPGTLWVADEATTLQTRFGGDLVVGSKGPASALLSILREAEVRVREASTSDYLDACGQFFDAVQNQRVRHVSQSELDTAARHATWRDVGGRRGFDLKAGHDISPLEAVSMAAWAAVQIGDPVSDIF
jgi:hypothetical protein